MASATRLQQARTTCLSPAYLSGQPPMQEGGAAIHKQRGWEKDLTDGLCVCAAGVAAAGRGCDSARTGGKISITPANQRAHRRPAAHQRPRICSVAARTTANRSPPQPRVAASVPASGAVPRALLWLVTGCTP